MWEGSGHKQTCDYGDAGRGDAGRGGDDGGVLGLLRPANAARALEAGPSPHVLAKCDWAANQEPSDENVRVEFS